MKRTLVLKLRTAGNADGVNGPGCRRPGTAFEFAGSDYRRKMAQLEVEARDCSTVNELLRRETGVGQRPEARGSAARALHRLTCGCKFVYLLMEGLVDSLEADSGAVAGAGDIRGFARAAYFGSMQYYHPTAVRMAVSAGLYLLPGRETFLSKLGIPEDAIQSEAVPAGRRFVKAARPLTDAVYALLHEHGVRL